MYYIDASVLLENNQWCTFHISSPVKTSRSKLPQEIGLNRNILTITYGCIFSNVCIDDIIFSDGCIISSEKWIESVIISSEKYIESDIISPDGCIDDIIFSSSGIDDITFGLCDRFGVAETWFIVWFRFASCNDAVAFTSTADTEAVKREKKYENA